jgi:predicted amidohydrolase YtcJ
MGGRRRAIAYCPGHVVAGTSVGTSAEALQRAPLGARALNGLAGPDWGLEQCLTREEPLRLLTYWPACAAFQERNRGTVEAGNLADFTVLSADIMQVLDSHIVKTRVVYTIIGGEVVFWSK